MTNQEVNEIVHLRDGGEWADHEDSILGNRAGILALRRACDRALSEGAYYGEDLGDWVSVKCLESDWFDAPSDSNLTRFSNGLLAGLLLMMALMLVVGVYQTVIWALRFFG